MRYRLLTFFFYSHAFRSLRPAPAARPRCRLPPRCRSPAACLRWHPARPSPLPQGLPRPSPRSGGSPVRRCPASQVRQARPCTTHPLPAADGAFPPAAPCVPPACRPAVPRILPSHPPTRHPSLSPLPQLPPLVFLEGVVMEIFRLFQP